MPAREERKLVSVLFVDVVGSTARAHGADPEDIRDFLRRFHEPVRRLVAQHGGIIEKFIGDAVVAVFGTPLAHGDDALRAVRCALGIAGATEDLNRADATLQLAVRAAVATGEALVELGSEAGKGEAIAVGDVMNVAARLQAAAPPGGVVVGELTERATRRQVLYRPLEPVAAKGIPDPVPVWLAEGLREETAVQAPLCGRGAELAALQVAFQRAAAGGGPQVAAVLGPPGMGKSRLAAELRSWVLEQGGAAYRGRCVSYAERRAYQASVDQIKQVAGIYEGEEPVAARAKLAEAVAGLVDEHEVADLIHHLSLVLGLGLDEPVKARQPLFFAVRRLVDALAAAGPVLLVFDDLHWADESQLELLDYLRAHLSGPALLLCLGRPELRQDQAAWLAATEVLDLQPLDAADSAALADALLGSESPGELEGMLATAGGNPLFLEELAASVRQGTALAERMPVTIREAIAAHIDALPSEEREVLLDAAVVGDTFWRGVLAGIRQAAATDLDGSLAALAAHGLVRVSGSSQVEDREFAFKHVLVQEVAYGTLTRAERRRRHAAVARHVEAQAGADRSDLAAFLAHHWRAAGEAAKAIEYLLLAAEAARAAWALEEVLAHFEAALELAGDDGALRTRIRFLRGLALVHLDELVRGGAELDAVIPELEPKEELEAVLARTVCAYWLEETEAALEFAERGRRLAEDLGDPELRAVAALYEGMAHEYTGDLDQLQARYADARRLWVPGKRRAEFAALNEYEADYWYWAGDYERSERLARAAYEMGEGHQLGAFLRGGGWRGLSLAAQGRSEEALDWLERMFETAQAVDPRWGASTLNYASLPLRDMLRLEEAAERNRRALELVATRGAWGMPELQAEIDLCLTHLLLGDPGYVQREFPRLWDAAINGRAWRPWLGGVRLALVRAELARQTEGPAELAEQAAEACHRGIQTRRRKYEAAARGLLGIALARLDRVERARAELARAVEIADELASPTPRWQLRLDQSRVLYELGDDAGAEAAHSAAAEVMRAYASALGPENARHFLAAEPVRSVLRPAESA